MAGMCVDICKSKQHPCHCRLQTSALSLFDSDGEGAWTTACFWPPPLEWAGRIVNIGA